MAVTAPGSTCTLLLAWLDDENGSPANADQLQVDITYGNEAYAAPDVAGGGPFTFTGATTAAPNTIWQTGTGTYAFMWQVPEDVQPGVYTITWTVSFQGDQYLVPENFYVAAGAGTAPVPAGDVGYWTGGLIYPAVGLDIEFGTVDPETGICWLLNKVVGWDGPDVQGGGVIAKSGDHGAWASPQYYAARPVTLTVTASAPTQALRDVARDMMQQAVPISDLATFRYDEPVPKMAQVRRSGKLPETYPTLCDVQFQVGLIAPDPRKYGTVAKSVTVNATPSGGGGVTMPITLPMVLPSMQPGGSIAVTNAGRFETEPVITVVGPITSPALVNVTTGQTVSWSGLVVPAGQSFVVDFSIGQATLGGSYRPADPFSSWWDLPAGTSTIAIQGQGDTGASMTINWWDAYI